MHIDRLYAECVRAIRETEYAPHIGPEHRWSDAAAAYLRRGWWARMADALRARTVLPVPLFGASKLFVLLAWGTAARWAPTGFETSLRARLLDYPDHTVQLADVFREAYGLCRGDLYLALLSALNVLCDRHWRPDRNAFPLHRKLVYLRKDSTAEGDNFGVWYHFFGSAVFGLTRPRWKTRSVGILAAMLDLVFLTADAQKTWSNLIGAELGARLRQVAQTERVASAPRPGVSAARADGGPDLMRTS